MVPRPLKSLSRWDLRRRRAEARETTRDPACRAAGRWLRHMREAWREAGVDERIQETVFESLGPLARHMVNADQDVPREPQRDAFLQ